ncbi:hypothetical protein NIASO_10900 [Niabella soli DSM 19437]|uniref:Carbohydrate-binding protein SusD n=2 Tax=Niabella TaxID=379899 RepID=W0F3K4_9BACT|nr:hypothetical protein NIASO_10900 [Niabella soli DSM 19437]
MNMKNIFYGLFFVALACSLTGCKKFLDQKPQTEIAADVFWKSEDDIKGGVAAMYDGIQSIFDNNYTLYGDARTDEVRVGQYGNISYAMNGLAAGITGSDWTNFYVTILRANLGIKNIPIVKAKYQTGIDQKAINHYLAQCYTTRALCYFWLIRLWGDVPVWTEPYDDISIEPNRARTSKDIIIDTVILRDLKLAASLSNPSLNNVYEANIGATYSLLMDVAMWKKDYASAITWYDDLVALKKYSLEPTATWKNLFINPTATKESIWSVYWDWTLDGGADVSTLIGAGNTNSDFEVEDSVWTYWTKTPADIRGPQTIDFKNSSHDKFLKFYAPNLDAKGNQLYPNGAEANILFPIYRWADILLLRAEAANKLEDRPTALKLLNQVRARAGVAAYRADSLNNQPIMENAILAERKLELYMEAKRWFDLERTDKVIEVMDPILKYRQTRMGSPAVGFGDPRTILWPINRNVLDANNKLVQNPPY